MDFAHLILSVHVLAGASLGAALSVTAMSLYKSVTHYYKPLTITLAGIIVTLGATGIALFVLSPNASLVELCANMGVYLSLTAVAEYLLVKNIRQANAEVKIDS